MRMNNFITQIQATHTHTPQPITIIMIMNLYNMSTITLDHMRQSTSFIGKTPIHQNKKIQMNIQKKKIPFLGASSFFILSLFLLVLVLLLCARPFTFVFFAFSIFRFVQCVAICVIENSGESKLLNCCWLRWFWLQLMVLVWILMKSDNEEEERKKIAAYTAHFMCMTVKWIKLLWYVYVYVNCQHLLNNNIKKKKPTKNGYYLCGMALT